MAGRSRRITAVGATEILHFEARKIRRYGEEVLRECDPVSLPNAATSIPTHEVQPERVETDAVQPQVLIHEREAYRGNVGTSKVWVSGRPDDRDGLKECPRRSGLSAQKRIPRPVKWGTSSSPSMPMWRRASASNCQRIVMQVASCLPWAKPARAEGMRVARSI